MICKFNEKSQNLKCELNSHVWIIIYMKLKFEFFKIFEILDF